MPDFNSNIWKMYAIKLLKSMMFVSGVLIPFFTDWGNLNFTQILAIQSWFLFWVFALEVPTGTIADVYGNRISIMLASLIAAAGAVVYASTPHFFIFLMGELFFAVAVALMSGADKALLYETLKYKKTESESKAVFSKYKSFGLAGILISAPIGSFIAATIGLRETMFFTAVPFGAAFLLAFTLMEPNVYRARRKKKYFETMFSGLSYLKYHKILRILAVDMVSIAAIGYFIIWSYQKLLINMGVDIIYFGWVHALMVAVQIFVLSKMKSVEKIFGGKRAFIFFSSIITGISFIASALLQDLTLLVISLMFAFSFSLTREPVFDSYFNKYIPSDRRATVLSSISMFKMLSIAVAAPVIGYLIDISITKTLVSLGILAIAFAFISKVKERMLKE